MDLVEYGLLASGACAREAVPPSVPSSVDGAVRWGLSASIVVLPDDGRVIADTGRNSKSPQSSPFGPRVPDSVTFARLPTPETLHAPGRFPSLGSHKQTDRKYPKLATGLVRRGAVSA